MNTVILLLGSNINFPEKNIDIAIELISNNIGGVIVESSKINTFPVEFVSENNFCNIAVSICTRFSPIQLLKELKKIEKAMGREEDSAMKGQYEDRIIDIDVVLFNGINFKSKILRIPHNKHLYNREFSRKLLSQINIHEYEK